MFAKPTDTHQFLDPTSSHLYHCKKRIPYNQALRLNRICSDNETFDRRYNEFEKGLMGRGYNEKMIRKQILSAREYPRNDFLEKETHQLPERKLTFSITYYPVFRNVRGIMKELHIFLTPNKEHKKAFPDILLEKETHQLSDKKLTFNITYYPVFRNVRGIMKELHVLLTHILLRT